MSEEGENNDFATVTGPETNPVEETETFPTDETEELATEAKSEGEKQVLEEEKKSESEKPISEEAKKFESEKLILKEETKFESEKQILEEETKFESEENNLEEETKSKSEIPNLEEETKSENTKPVLVEETTLESEKPILEEIKSESVKPELENVLEESRSEEIDLESILTEYDADDFIFTAITSKGSSLPVNLFEFEYSYGYNSKKYYNLCACDEEVVAWSAGNVITFYNVVSKEVWFKKSSTGGTICHIASYTKNSLFRIAVAEGGYRDKGPVIIVYVWPSMQIDAVLYDGTANGYSVMDFNPDGDLLAAVGCEPDYNLTIYSWKVHRILLRTSAFSFDVFNVVFSPTVPGQLTTAGAGHIKFWKMAQTFTGLKLKGDLGRFGKTEICDVLGVYPMADENVLSGCEWGNILVWEAGLVKIEVTQRGRKTCHNGPIVQFLLMEDGGEVVTIARDGFIRAWYWDTVMQADPPEDDQFVELNPVAETEVPGADILCIRQRKDHIWYAQDGNGSVWCVDVELDNPNAAHTRVWMAHSGSVQGSSCVRSHPLLVTLGEKGSLHVHEYQKKVLLYRYEFLVGGRCLFYVPEKVDPSSLSFIVGLADGAIKLVYLNADMLLKFLPKCIAPSIPCVTSEDKKHGEILKIITVLKPHSAGVTAMSMNVSCNLLITAGEDSTIFMYRVINSDKAQKPFDLLRIGYMDTPKVVYHMSWKPHEEQVVLLSGEGGLLLEVELPEAVVQEYDLVTSFKLHFVKLQETFLQKCFIRHKPLPDKDDLVSLDESEATSGKSDDKAEEEEYVGEVELAFEGSAYSTIRWAEYDQSSLAGYVWTVQEHTGSLLYLRLGQKDVFKYAPIPDAWCDNLTHVQFVCDNKYVLIGTGSGHIRVLRMPTPDEDNSTIYEIRNSIAQQKLMKQLAGKKPAKAEPDPIRRLDLTDHYVLPMHDRYSGAITNMFFSSDGKQMFSTGADGNIFSYNVNFMEKLVPTYKPLKQQIFPEILMYSSLRWEADMLCHEQLKQREERDKALAIADAHKKLMRDKLALISADYNKLIKLNRQLPQSQQIDLVLDMRPLLDLENILEDQKRLEYRKLEYETEVSDIALNKMMDQNIVEVDVFPFKLQSIRNPNVVLRPLRQKNLSQKFFDQLEEVHRKMAEAALRRSNKFLAGYGNIIYAYGTELLKHFCLPGTFQEYSDAADVVVFLLRTETRNEIYPVWFPYFLVTSFASFIVTVLIYYTKSGDVVLKKTPKKLVWGPPRVPSFLTGLSILRQQPHPLTKAIRDYHRRLNRHHDQNIEWQEHLSHKPDPNALPPGATEMLREAELTIGDFCLKTQPDYTPSSEHNTQLRLCLCRQEIYQLKHDFNVKVLKLREDKLALVEKLKSICCRLAEIRQEIPGHLVKAPPIIPDVNEDLEFPEKNLEVVIETVEPKSGKKSADVVRKTLSSGVSHCSIQPRVPRFVDFIERRPTLAMWELLKAKDDEEETDLQKEIKERRTHRRLYEQDVLLAEAQVATTAWDDRINLLQRERIRVQERSHLLELHLLQLHGELIVLNRFEAKEDELTTRVYEKLAQVNAVQDQLEWCRQAIEEQTSELHGLQTQVAQLQQQFKQLVQDNKHAQFLRRIFRKKYRAPRRMDSIEEESSEESSSTTSSEDEDEGSLDSRDIGPIHLDPNICPEGCDQEVYNQTFELRALRHSLEQSIQAQERIIDSFKKEADNHIKIARKLAVQLEKRQNTLREFMREKQSCLNSIDCTVVLRYSAIRAGVLQDCLKNGIQNALLLPGALLKQLKARVLELEEEIEQQNRRHKVNRTHLHRMNIDCRFMEGEVVRLNAATRLAIETKMGAGRRQVDKHLDILLRRMTRRFKFYGADNQQEQLQTQLQHWRKRYSDLEHQYIKALEVHSESLRLAAALQADTYPTKSMRNLKQRWGGYAPSEFVRDVVRLRIVDAQQQEQIQILENEILKFKSKNVSPRPPNFLPSQPPDSPHSAHSELSLFKLPPKRKLPKRIFFTAGEDESEAPPMLMTSLQEAVQALGARRGQESQLLQVLTLSVQRILRGETKRHEELLRIINDWLTVDFEDPNKHNMNTIAFDWLNKAMDVLMTQHLSYVEVHGKYSGEQERNTLSVAEVEKLVEVALQQAGGAWCAPLTLQVWVQEVLHTMLGHAPIQELQSAMTVTIIVSAIISQLPDLTGVKENISIIDHDAIATNLADAGDASPGQIVELVNSIKSGLLAQLVSKEEEASVKGEVDGALDLAKQRLQQDSIEQVFRPQFYGEFQGSEESDMDNYED